MHAARGWGRGESTVQYEGGINFSFSCSPPPPTRPECLLRSFALFPLVGFLSSSPISHLIYLHVDQLFFTGWQDRFATDGKILPKKFLVGEILSTSILSPPRKHLVPVQFINLCLNCIQRIMEGGNPGEMSKKKLFLSIPFSFSFFFASKHFPQQAKEKRGKSKSPSEREREKEEAWKESLTQPSIDITTTLVVGAAIGVAIRVALRVFMSLF